MSSKQIYDKLCLIAEELKIKVIKGKGNFKGGSCLVKEESIIVINHNQPFEGRIRNLALSLLEFNLDKIKMNKKIKQILTNIKYEEESNE
jgi:hypothetical protein|tara:strand:+ start:52 stop:321 length:270 start_codon:yes stop_codon:yes gene_type:complete